MSIVFVTSMYVSLLAFVLVLQVRSQVAYGSVGEVERFEKLVGVKAMAGAEA